MTNAGSASIDDGAKLGTLGALCLFLSTSTLPILFIYAYSGIGVGLETALESKQTSDDAEEVLTVVGTALLIAYLFDLNVLNPRGMLSKFLATALAFLTVIALLLLTGKNPYWPICIFTVVVPLLLIGLRYLLFQDVGTVVYIQKTSVILVLIGSAIAVLFLAWIAAPMIGIDSPVIDGTGMGNEWDSETRAIYAKGAGCTSSFEELPHCKSDVSDTPCFYSPDGTVSFSKTCTKECLDVYEECSISFIIWVNPGLAALSLIIMGFIAKFLQPRDLINNNVLTVVKSSAVFLFLFWIFASLAGAGDGLTGSLIAFAISMLVGTSIIAAAIIRRNASDIGGDWSIGDVIESHKSYLDIAKGLVVLALSPVLVVYLVLSVLNQTVRKVKSLLTGVPIRHQGCLTQTAAEQVEDFKNWNHSRVLTYAAYWGYGYVFLNVLASKFTTVFLSWLIETTSEMSIPAVTVIVVLVGMGLFMLPPIPGLPIYLTGGIVLVSVGRETLGLVSAIVYATSVGLGTKLLACAIQQKIIGGMLGGSISVKQVVSVNSDGVRAMRLILSDKGITARKVAVLVGGPDWPVSVLCGILGLDLLPIIYGTLPVILVITPTVLTGSFAFMGSLETDDGLDKYPWADTMGTVSSALAACLMFYFTFAAAGAISSSLETDKEEIAALEYDKEVEAADAEEAKLTVVRERVTVWNNIPTICKLLLISSVLSMMACCCILVMFNEQSFKDYDLMYTIDEHLGGNWMSIVKPLGRVALLFFVTSYILLSIYNSWANRETQRIITANGEEFKSLTESTGHGTYV